MPLRQWICCVIVFVLCSPFCQPTISFGEQKGLVEQTKDIVTQTDDRKWVKEKTGVYIPLDTEFVDSTGKAVTLRDIVTVPVILLPIYFYCPGSCSTNLANLAVALNYLNFQPGKDFRVIALSFNEAEKVDDARRAKRNYLKIVDDTFPASDWSFLTGTRANIEVVTEALGYRFKRMDDGTFVHTSALAVIADDGQIIRYVYGKFLSGDLDIGIADAKKGVPALSVKRLLDFCFNYRPNADNSIFQIVKVSVLVCFFVVVVGVILFFKRKKIKGSSEDSQK